MVVQRSIYGLELTDPFRTKKAIANLLSPAYRQERGAGLD